MASALSKAGTLRAVREGGFYAPRRVAPRPRPLEICEKFFCAIRHLEKACFARNEFRAAARVRVCARLKKPEIYGRGKWKGFYLTVNQRAV
ncbi:MAG: hypothetical protein DBX55_00040 [Verrucomicrobia bacterium]|nr:MAG: hypothetical protein DBX55_00040 [Verrucomicrobiota bacterium]